MNRPLETLEFVGSQVTLIEAQTFTYHDSGMLKNVLIEDSDGTDEDINETYLYNGQGQRIIKTFVQDTTTSVARYLYSGSAVIMTSDSASIKITENNKAVFGV